jgi:hypothetical protein
MAIAAAEVIVPADGTSIELSAGAANQQVWLQATYNNVQVYIGPSGVTPASGLPIPGGRLVGPIALGANALHGVIGENQSATAVRIIRITP